MNVIIVPGVTIGEGVCIAAGSVVVKDIPPLALIGGNPATILKYRDKDKYEKAKENNFFIGKIRYSKLCKNCPIDKMDRRCMKCYKNRVKKKKNSNIPF